jgi:V/A-type H+-transporting ATPase subunit F
MTEKLGKEIPEIVDDIKLNRTFPLLLEIPDRHGSGRRPDFITAYINEAIGIKI